MKILHFVSSLSHGSGVMGVIMNYYRFIDRTKIQFDFICFIYCEESYEDEIIELGGHVFYLDKPNCSLAWLKKWNAFFRAHEKDYICLHNHEVYLSFLLRPLSKRYGISKFIVHCHATKYSDKPLNAIRNRVLCMPIKFIKCERIACSRVAGEFLYGKRRMDKKQVYVLQNAIDCKKFYFSIEKRNEIREEMGLSGKKVIGHIGRFERQKNHKFLIEVFFEIRKKDNKSVLLLIGDGSLRATVEKQVKDLGIEDSVYFLGQRSNLPDLLNIMDVFVLPSLYEGLPLSCVEALVNGLSCIVSDKVSNEMGSFSNIIYKSLALKSAWVIEIVKMLNSKRSPKLMVVPPQFDIEKQAMILEKIYRI